MWTFLNQVVSGLVLTGPVLLIAVSLSAVLASSRVLNIAVGAAYALVAVLAIKVQSSAGTVMFLAFCLLAPVVLFLVLDLVVLSPQRRTAREPEMASFAATIGISLIFTGFAAMASDSAILSLPPKFLRVSGSWRWSGLRIPKDGAIVIVVATALAVGFWLAMYRSSIGVRFRATSADPFLAKTVGIRPSRVIRMSWLVSGLLTGVATILLLVVDRSVSITSGGDLLLLPFAAVIAGGMGSVTGAALASLLLGLSQALLTLVTSSGGVQSALVFGLLFIMLIFRPEGIVATSRSTRAY